MASEHLTKEKRVAHVRVRLEGRRPNGEWIMEWRQVNVRTLGEAFLEAAKMPDVLTCYEASWEPGGVIT